MTEENRTYITHLKVTDVPWHRLTTAYGRGTDFPAHLAVLEQMEDIETVKKSLYELTTNMEHQSTLWHAKDHLEDACFRDMSGCDLAEIEQTAGERCQPIGQIGYYYPAEVWISEHGKLYAKYDYQDEIECFPDVFVLIERDLRACKFDSAAMKTVEALDGKL